MAARFIKVRLYSAHHHSCFLYLASILVDVYGGEPDCMAGLLSMLEALLPPAFALLQEPLVGFCNHPDTVDDLFRLLARFLQRCPSPFLRSPALAAVFDCAIRAATLDHRDANASVMQFLSELVHTTRAREVCWVARLVKWFRLFRSEIFFIYRKKCQRNFATSSCHLF